MSRSWDARAYDRVSGPQARWAEAVLDRLALQGDETVLDAGCGSGRVTALLVQRLPEGEVVAVDADAEMVAHARAALGDGVEVRHESLLELQLEQPVDAVFSNAVLHWIDDHERLFDRLFAVLRPGGRLSAQCGGAGNVARLQAIADELAPRPPARRPWHFATARDTERRLVAAGFEDVRCWLHEEPTLPDDPRAYLETVCLGPYLDALSAEEQEPFLDAVLERSGGELDYVRLDIDAGRPE